MSHNPLPCKIPLIGIAIIALLVASSTPCDAQRRKRGLLSGPKSTQTPTDSADKEESEPTTGAVAQPATGSRATATPAKKGPVDLFEMASKNAADKKAAAEAGAKSGTDKDGKVQAPPPEILTLESDGINIMAALFMSPNTEDPELAKTIVPIILVHDWGGTMNDLGPLAQYLQSVGHTVIVPDLRGHGRSVTMANAPRPLDYRDFNRAQIATVTKDIEECKKKLIGLNNEGKLNISMLSVLAVGETCPLVTGWTLKDWSYENRGSIKQGKDVQSLILVSPPKKFQQLSMPQLVRHPLLAGGAGIEIPTLIIYGRNGDSAKESSALYKLMSRKRPASNASDANVRWAQQSLFELVIPSSADGASLLGPNPALYRFLGMFNFYKVSRNADNFPWASRASGAN